MKTHARVVAIGGGINGCSVLFDHVAEECRAVVCELSAFAKLHVSGPGAVLRSGKQ